MPDTSEVTSDYSGSLTPTSSEDEEQEDNSSVKLNENSALLWTSSGSKKSPYIMFRPESLITRDKKLKSIGEKYHLAYKMVKTESKLVRSVLSAYGFHEVHPNSAEFNLMWTGAHLKPFSLRSLQDFQKVNHFPRSYEITRKDRLYKNIERMAHTKGAKHFDFIPKSFLMPSEYQEFCSAYVKEKGSWIVKPIASSRGRGIYLINNPNQVPLEDNIMVCKYISNPLLIDGFKFDVRVYVAITSYDPLLIYLFEEGLTRFATVKYEKTNRQLKNQMMHLTNYSINKKSHDYVRCEDPDVEDYGNKWSMSAMLRYLKQEGIDTSTLMSRIEGVIIKSILAAELPIATACKMFVPHKENCIELYGFDILIDENLKPWILEGNLSPSLACDAPLDLKIKSSMVADFFSIAGFRCIDPMSRRPAKKQMDLLQRPYSAQRSGSALGSNRGSKRPSSAGYKDVGAGAAKTGLTTEESRVLAMAKEQYQRRGSFVRIFPTVETWEVYGSFLEYKSNLNRMLAQKLFPERAKPIHGAYSAAVARIRSLSSSQMIESRHQVISERFMQYERKLYSLESHKRRRTTTASHKKSKHRETPVGIDNKYKKRSIRSRQSSSDEDSDEGDEEEDEEEPESTRQSKNTKSSAKSNTLRSNPSRSNPSKSNPSLSSGDAASVSKSVKQEAKTAVDRTQKVKSSSNSKGEDGAESGSSSASSRQQSQTKSIDTKPFKHISSSSSKSVPAQRVYMYKSNSPSESVATSPERQSTLETKPDASSFNAKSDSGDQTNPSSKDFKSSTTTSTSSFSQEIAKKISIINQKQAASKGERNHKLVDVLAILRSGGNLGKLQARQAFSAYLSRVQHRLRLESEGQVHEVTDAVYKQEEQMDLVLRFLKRAAGNLCQSFSVVVPSRRLPIVDRKRILSKQLAEFVRIYNKESDAMEHKQHLGLDKDLHAVGSVKAVGAAIQAISDADFRNFISNATESGLEEVLTAYTHKNKSASVFLGASKAKAPSSRYSDKEESSSASESSSTTALPQQPNKGYNIPSASTTTSSYYNLQNDELKEKTHHSSMTSLQQAAYIYGAKSSGLSQPSSARRPASAKPFMPGAGSVYSASQASMRPGSPANRPLSGSIHYQTAVNQEAISDALQRLTERQAARQYSASVQLTALSKHLSNLNLANMNSSQHHRMGSSELLHMNSPQRTSSLCDLANSDPSVQSMIDPGSQKFGHSSNGDANDQSERSMSHSSSHESLYSKSAHTLTQQSNTLLQQSKAKHQAMLAQMLEVWRNRQQTEMRAGPSINTPVTSFSNSNCQKRFQELYNCLPYPAAGRDSDFMGCLKLDNEAEQAEDGLLFSDSSNYKDLLLLERTEKIVNSSSSETIAKGLSQNTFLNCVVNSKNRGKVKTVKQAWASASNKTEVEPKRKKVIKVSAKQSSQNATKTTHNSKSTKSKKPPIKGSAATKRLADRPKGSDTVRNIFFYENILKEINHLFEMGELPTKQWKEGYRAKRK